MESTTRYCAVIVLSAACLCVQLASAQTAQKIVLHKAKIDASDLEITRKAPIAFKPIPMADGKTGRAIKPNEVAKLPWGETITAREFFKRLNAYEKRINALGYSVRNGKAGLPVATLHVDKQAFQTQARHLSVLHERNAPSRKIRPAVRVKGAPIRLDKASLKFSPAVSSANRLAAARTVDEFNQKSYAVDQVDGLMVNPTEINTVSKAHVLPSGITYSDGLVQRLIGYPTLPAETYKSIPFSHHKPWNWSVGFQYFGASYDGTFDVSGKADSTQDNSMANSVSEFHVSTQGHARINLFKDSYEVLRYGANYDTYDQTKKVNVGANIYVTGIKLFDFNNTYSTNTNFPSGLSLPFSIETSELQFPVAWVFTLTGKVGASGVAGVSYNLALQSNGIYGEITPSITSNATAEVGIGVDVGVASASVGVGGNLTLLNDTLTIGAKLGIGWLGNFYLRDEIYMSNNLDALDGDLYLWGNVQTFGFTVASGHICDLVNWQGFHDNSTWFDWKNSVKLDWN